MCVCRSAGDGSTPEGSPRKPEDIVTEIWLDVFGRDDEDGQGKASAPAGAATTD